MDSETRPKILVIEDSRDTRLLIPRRHKDEGEIIIPDTLEEVMQRLSNEVFDLVICDIHVNKGNAYCQSSTAGLDLYPGTGPEHLVQAERSHVKRILLNSTASLPNYLLSLAVLQRHGFLDAVVGSSSKGGCKDLNGISFTVLTAQQQDRQGLVRSMVTECLGTEPVRESEIPFELDWALDSESPTERITFADEAEMRAFAISQVRPTIKANFDRLCQVA